MVFFQFCIFFLFRIFILNKLIGQTFQFHLNFRIFFVKNFSSLHILYILIVYFGYLVSFFRLISLIFVAIIGSHLLGNGLIFMAFKIKGRFRKVYIEIRMIKLLACIYFRSCRKIFLLQKGYCSIYFVCVFFFLLV